MMNVYLHNAVISLSDMMNVYLNNVTSSSLSDMMSVYLHSVKCYPFSG